MKNVLLFGLVSLFPILDVANIVPSYVYLSLAWLTYIRIVLRTKLLFVALHPLVFITTYFMLSLGIADFFFAHNLIKHPALHLDIITGNIYKKETIIKIYLACLWVLNISFFSKLVRLESLPSHIVSRGNTKGRSYDFRFFSIILVPLLFIDISASTPFYSGYFTHYIAIYFCLAVLLGVGPGRPYFFSSLLILLVIFITFKLYGDRREIIYFIYSGLIIYTLRNPQARIKYSYVLAAPIMTVTLVLLATVFRMSDEGPAFFIYNFDIFCQYISNYWSLENLSYFIAVNSDSANFYIHGINSINAILSGDAPLLYGSTIAKPLFIFIPREWYPDLKPDSMLTIYTTFFDPIYRSHGNSYPINFIAELFWNFHFASIVLMSFFSYLVGKAYLSLFRIANISNIFYLTLSVCSLSPFLSSVRGAGWEYLFYSMIFFTFIASLHFLEVLIRRRHSR